MCRVTSNPKKPQMASMSPPGSYGANIMACIPTSSLHWNISCLPAIIVRPALVITSSISTNYNTLSTARTPYIPTVPTVPTLPTLPTAGPSNQLPSTPCSKPRLPLPPLLLHKLTSTNTLSNWLLESSKSTPCRSPDPEGPHPS